MFLLCRYLKRPRDPKRTHEKGYMSNKENYAWDEVLGMSRNIKKRDITEYNVILNILEKEIVKCSFPAGAKIDNADFDSVFGYFYNNYRDRFDRMFAAAGLEIAAKNSDGNDIVATEDPIVSTEPEAV